MATEWLRINDACRRYGVSRSTINRMLKNGAPHVKTSAGRTGAVLIDAEAFDNWLRSHQVGGDTVPQSEPTQ